MMITLLALCAGASALAPSSIVHRGRSRKPATLRHALNERDDILRAKDLLLGRQPLAQSPDKPEAAPAVAVEAMPAAAAFAVPVTAPVAKAAKAVAVPAAAPLAGDWDIELCSPSKINLFLRIVRRRDDGYHDLASLFQAIKLSDQLGMSLLAEGVEDDAFECNMEGVPVDRTNLVLRAVDVFREKTGVDRKFKIRLEKTVPAQAGLGGGSGNAATALWGCNELCKANGLPTCTHEELVEISTGLGSDATFFLSEGTAFCTGRGEVLTPLKALPSQGLYIVKPEVGLSTPAVFKALDLDGRSTADPLALLGLHTMGAEGPDKYVNDLEKPAFSVIPELAALREKLTGLGFPVVSMSGSGTSIFCLGEPSAEAASGEDWAAELEAGGEFPWPIRVFKTEFLSRPSTECWYSV